MSGQFVNGGHAAATVPDAMLAGEEEGESESIKELRLKLALVQAESEARERSWAIEQEIIVLQGGSHGARPATERLNVNDVLNIKSTLPRMSDEDALTFFHAFERALQLNDVDKSVWVKYLTSQLTPKALRAFAKLSLDESRDYDVVKRTVLSYYKLDAGTYLKAFRSHKRTGKETYKMSLNKMRELLNNYYEAKQIDSFESLSDAVLQEQFLASLLPDVRKFVYSKQPETAAQCSEYADVCFQIKSMADCNDNGGGAYFGAMQGQAARPF